MAATSTTKHPKLYGYTASTDQTENDADAKRIYGIATKDKASKLVIFGGLHGYEHTGIPTAQSPSEKGVCSFSMGDRISKSPGTGLNFTYENVAKLTSPGMDVSEENQREIVEKIKRYLDSGNYYVLLSWCYSRVWAVSLGL